MFRFFSDTLQFPVYCIEWYFNDCGYCFDNCGFGVVGSYLYGDTPTGYLENFQVLTESVIIETIVFIVREMQILMGEQSDNAFVKTGKGGARFVSIFNRDR